MPILLTITLGVIVTYYGARLLWALHMNLQHDRYVAALTLAINKRVRALKE